MAANRRQSEKDDRLNWRYQDKDYNELFKKWRKHSRDRHGFYYVDKSNELTYQDGFGFVKEYPEAVERNALMNVYNIIGVTMIIVALLDIVMYYVLPVLMAEMGIDIYYDMYTHDFYGNEWLVMLIYLAFEIMKRLLPFLYCYKKLKMPIKVMIPTRIANRPMFNIAVPMMLLVSGVCAAATGFYEQVLSGLHIAPREDVHLPQGTGEAIFCVIVNVLIIPAISEIYTRGTVMQLLRQFGDGTAVMFTAFLTAMISYNLHQFCYVFITSVVIGYFTIRTGSVITAVIMRIVTRAFAYTAFAIDTMLPPEIDGVVEMMFLFVCIMIGLIVFVGFLLKHSDKLGMSLDSRYLSFSEKILSAFTCVPIVIGATMMVIIILMRIKIEF
ncbi:MAG: CPBP family intramembrane metalloprotease [Oscillospiraceae bacterium]|nr:CPBP family intramembrane metalloprotease [Oscillospiraceae bacterium]